MNKNQMSFEEALKGLKDSTDNITLKDNTLEEAISAYNEGLEYYEVCKSILENSKQKIQIINK